MNPHDQHKEHKGRFEKVDINSLIYISLLILAEAYVSTGLVLHCTMRNGAKNHHKFLQIKAIFICMKWNSLIEASANKI